MRESHCIPACLQMFQDLYAKADEDTRRAMNKSYQESNGTVLSTNWKDIGSRKVSPHADDEDKKKDSEGRKGRRP